MSRPTQLTPPEPVALWRFDVFDPVAFAAWSAPALTPPEPCRSRDCDLGRVIWIEPAAFLLCPAEGRAPPTPPPAVGARTDVSGGLLRMTLTGPGWRSLLTLEGLLDVEGPAFAAGACASTLIHHAPVLLDVIEDEGSHLYTPPSYSRHAYDFWREAIERYGAGSPP